MGRVIVFVILIFCNHYLEAADLKPYIEVDGGFALHQGARWQNEYYSIPYDSFFPITHKIKFSPGSRTDLKVGLHFKNHWDVELESGLIHNKISDSSQLFSVPVSRVELNQVPVLLNLKYNIPLKGPVSPFLGIGLGGILGNIETSLPTLPTIPTQNKTDVAMGFQAMAGIKYQVSSHIDIELTYKMLHANAYNWAFVDGSYVFSALIFSPPSK